VPAASRYSREIEADTLFVYTQQLCSNSAALHKFDVIAFGGSFFVTLGSFGLLGVLEDHFPLLVVQLVVDRHIIERV